MRPGAPALWFLTKRLPQSWRMALLKALAYPEYEASEVLLHPDPRHPFGHVWLHPIEGSLIEEPYPCPESGWRSKDRPRTTQDQPNVVEFKR